MTSEKDQRIQIFVVELGLAVLLGLIYFNLSSIDLDLYRHGIAIVRYTFYILLLKAVHITRDQFIKTLSGKQIHLKKLVKEYRTSLLVFTSTGSLLIYSGEALVNEQFILLLIADLICQFIEMGEQRPIINYGVGMACSYFEGYLMNIIPSDGGMNLGLQKKIQDFEDREKVIFPVKKLLVVVTQSLYCPPDLLHFNKDHRPDLAQLEACRSLEGVEKDVAGVKNRSYRNSTYKIVQPGYPPDEGIFVVAEFASPLNTFYKVIKNRDLYDTLAGVDSEEIKEDFCYQLERTVQRNLETRGLVHLVHYDDTAPEENLADVLLKEIARFEPNYDQIVKDHAHMKRINDIVE